MMLRKDFHARGFFGLLDSSQGARSSSSPLSPRPLAKHLVHSTARTGGPGSFGYPCRTPDPNPEDNGNSAKQAGLALVGPILTLVWGLGFGVWGLGFGVWGLGFGVWGLGFGVWVSGLRELRV